MASVLRSDDEICLLERSNLVGFDSDRWHCVTGYLPENEDALAQAKLEIWEETGLTANQIWTPSKRSVLVLADGNGNDWIVHAFLFDVATKAISLNWEHNRFLWLDRNEMASLKTVSWLPKVLERLL